MKISIHYQGKTFYKSVWLIQVAKMREITNNILKFEPSILLVVILFDALNFLSITFLTFIKSSLKWKQTMFYSIQFSFRCTLKINRSSVYPWILHPKDSKSRIYFWLKNLVLINYKTNLVENEMYLEHF